MRLSWHTSVVSEWIWIFNFIRNSGQFSSCFFFFFLIPLSTFQLSLRLSILDACSLLNAMYILYISPKKNRNDEHDVFYYYSLISSTKAVSGSCLAKTLSDDTWLRASHRSTFFVRGFSILTFARVNATSILHCQYFNSVAECLLGLSPLRCSRECIFVIASSHSNDANCFVPVCVQWPEGETDICIFTSLSTSTIDQLSRLH